MRNWRGQLSGRLPFAFFFLSGACGLVYEVVWTRLFALTLGAASYSIATVLAAYMGGLALGSWLATRIRSRVAPLALYGMLEIGIAAWAVLLPTLLALTEPVLRWAYRDGNASFASFLAVRFAFSVLLLVVPTTSMGATLPVLCRHFLRDSERIGRGVGLLYALNALGAVLGAAGSGFYLLPTFGQDRTTWIAAGVNTAIGAGALLLSRWTRTDPEPVAAPDPRPAGARRRPLVLVFASGIAAMVYQVAWTRSFSLSIGSSTYAFCLIVTAFIAGISLGSAVVSRFADHARDLTRLLAVLQLLVAAAALAVVPVHGSLPHILAPVFLDPSSSFERLHAIQFGVLLAMMLGPTFLMGATFPLAVRLCAGAVAGRGPRAAGIVYAWNTVGCIVGSLAGGFLALPYLGIERTIAAASAMNAAGALAIGWTSSAMRRAVVATAAIAVGGLGWILPRWDPAVLESGAYMLGVIRQAKLSPREMGDLGRLLRAPGRALYYREGVSATVSVREVSRGELVLRINGKNDASTTGDMPNQILLGHLPMLLCQENHPDVLHIGLGGGVSLGGITRHPVARVECVEIAPEVWEAAAFFAPYTHAALQDPRVVPITADGRNHLALTSRSYDAIVSQPSNPWISGIGNLFTREFFELCRAKLRAHGLAVVWLQSYSLTADDFRRVLATFSAVFPECSLWEAKPGSDYLLVGTLDPFHVDTARVEARMGVRQVREDLARIHLHSIDDLAACFVMGPAEVAAWGRGAGENTDDNAALEWSAPRSLYKPTRAWQVPEVNARRSADYGRWMGIGPHDVERFHEARKARALAAMGMSLIAEGEIDAAETALEAAIAARPSDPWARMRLAEVLAGRGAAFLAEGDPAMAETPLSRSAELDPRSWLTWNNLGLARAKLGKPSAALDAFQRALEIRPDAYEVLVNAASVHSAQRDWRPALDLLARATATDPHRAIAWMFLGNVHRETADWTKALTAYERALRCDPKDGRIHYLIAATYASMDPPQKDRAEAHLKMAKALGYPPEKR